LATLFEILGQVEILERMDVKITIADIFSYVLCFGGIVIFSSWLLRTSLGRTALTDSAPRQNNMPLYLPFVPIAFWLGLTLIGKRITNYVLPSLPQYQQVLTDYLVFTGAILVTMVVILILARETFVRRLKGFGFDIKTLGRDLPAAVVNLTAVFPIIMMVMLIVLKAGQLLNGDNFQIPKHEALQNLTTYHQMSMRVLMILVTVGIGPVFEEMLFRGLFQTMLRSVLARPWWSIVITSIIFTLMHPWMHWPALLVLSICMGYAYEKSGSLFRPIFIHTLFNAASVAATLSQ